jgi:AraC-like DNA-binding protein
MNTRAKTWQGSAAIFPGVGVYRGKVGDNKLHRHWAVQLTIGLDGPFGVDSRHGQHRAEVALIGTDTPHRLLDGNVVSLYIDPASSLATALLSCAIPQQGLVLLNFNDLQPGLAKAASDSNLNTLFSYVHSRIRKPASNDHGRMDRILAQIKQSVQTGHEMSRTDLAAVANLSPTRFSHWFKEHTGIPLRSYKKWLKLMLGIEAMLAGASPVEAALMAGFSDQAHFSRSFTSAFGLSASSALSAIKRPR